MSTKKTAFTDQEKELVGYFKVQLKSRGINKFPRDWHLKQLSTARDMLAGSTAPTLEQWKACIDWAFCDRYWKDKVDHLARILALWPQFVLKGGIPAGRDNRHTGKNQSEQESIRSRYINGKTGQVPI
ncbi:MAG: hypothetical protein QHH10_11985 [Peptococcaceae bacterium]|jgi:hypothetical protein|nr:hypothetical protein [Peptococcaceae bacterium]MDH7526023.1 hypothetical protein [Peptococcaceae bacterium]